MEGSSITIKDYEFIDQIGVGSFANVFKAFHKKTKTHVAIKVMSKEFTESPQFQKFLKDEIELSMKFDHPFIVNYYEYFEDEYNHYITMEYLENGDLLDEINRNSGLSEDKAHKYFCQIISGLEYLHSEMKVIHRDIKAENVLLDKYRNIRLVDFGLSKTFDHTNPFRDTICGSPAYSPPEMVSNQPYTSSTDIWSLGILLYLSVNGVLPFKSDSTPFLIHQILNREPIYPNNLSPEIVDLLKKLLKKDWKNRITLQEIKDHIWVRKNRYIITLSFDFGSSFSLNGFHSSTIDQRIMKKLTENGYETNGLIPDLLSGVVSERTAAFKMIRRTKIAKLIYKWLHEKLLGEIPLSPRPLTPRQLVRKLSSQSID